MAIVGTDEIFKKISSQVDSQFPGFIREEGPQFVAFLRAYFEYAEQSGNAIDASRSIKDNQDIDRTVDSFVEYFRREFMINIPKDALADQRLLTKHIREFYRTRGSQESYRFLFRVIFGKEIDFYYPGDDILRASDGRWVQEIRLRVGAPSSIDPRSLEGERIRGVNSGATAFVEDIIATEALGLLVYDMTVRNISGTFADGERIINADNPSEFTTVNSQVGSIVAVDVEDGGAFHTLGDNVIIDGAGSTEVATGIISEVTNRSAVTIKLAKAGSGYTKENTRLFISGGSGVGLAAKVESFTSQPIAGLSVNTDLIGAMRNVRLDTPSFFVRTEANTSTVATKLDGVVSTSTVSNTVTGTGTNFVTQLNVGDIVRIFGVANTARVHAITNATSFISAFTPFQNVSSANAYIGLAAANVDTRLVSALKFDNTALFSINAITLINPGRGYDSSLPTITIVDDFINNLNLDDGFGNVHGNNAVVIANNAPGSISKIRLTSAGSNFNKYEDATILNTSQSNVAFTELQNSSFANSSPSTRFLIRKKTFSAAGKARPSGFVAFPGRYIDTKGFLSWNNKLQDNFFYQEFSYVIRVSETLSKYRNVIKSLVHPAGVKLFGDFVVSSAIDLNITVIDEAPSLVRVSRIESINSIDVINATAEYNTGMDVSESVVPISAESGSFLANTNITESVVSDDIRSATFIANTSISESVTSIVIEDATFIANTFSDESVTTVTDESVFVIFDTSFGDGDLILNYQNLEISLEQTTEIGDIANIAVNVNDTIAATFIANTSISESVTSIVIEDATFIANTSISESVTSIVIEDATFIANTFSDESVTTVTDESVFVIFDTSSGDLILNYQNVQISSEQTTQIGDIEINLNDTVDATVS